MCEIVLLAPPVQRPPVEETIIEETKPKTHPNYIVIGAVTVLGVIVTLIIGFCVCKKCRQARDDDDGTESKAHPTDIPITDNNGFAGITNSLHKNNHNRSINITANPLADSDKVRNEGKIAKYRYCQITLYIKPLHNIYARFLKFSFRTEWNCVSYRTPIMQQRIL